MRLPVALLAALLCAPALAGCLDPGSTQTPASLLLPGDGPVAYDGRGQLVQVPTGLGALSFGLRDLQHEGAEPTLGIDGEGRIFVVSDTTIFRSDDHGATWADASPGATNWPAGSLDPYVWVDRDTGRVYADHLYVGCSYLLWSDDQGETWLNNPVACGLPGNDHQTLATGKPVGVPTVGYPNVLYYAYNGIAYTGVSRSLDGGVTFGGATIAIDPEHCGGLNGHLKVAPDGTVYVPAAGCDEPVVAVSRDSGLTWERHVIDTNGAGRSTPGDDPSIALDSAGNAYLVFPGKDARMYGSVSTDAGQTWSPAFRISPPGVTSSLMPASTAGEPGRVAFAYYGTTADTSSWPSPNSGDADPDARWHLYVTTSLDALAGEAATFVTTQVTPDENPVKIGRIHNGGGGDPDRNLLDFFDMATDPDGRVFVAFTSGCPAKCATQEDSRASATLVAILEEGPSLVHSREALRAPEAASPHAGHEQGPGALQPVLHTR